VRLQNLLTPQRICDISCDAYLADKEVNIMTCGKSCGTGAKKAVKSSKKMAKKK